jgi:hypothetical protein
MNKITASCTFNGHDLTDVPAINPGGWFGKSWLLELGGSYTSLFLVVEADSMSNAIDELSENETYGYQIHVPDEDFGDYPEDSRHYDGSGSGHRPRSLVDSRSRAVRRAIPRKVPRRRAARRRHRPTTTPRQGHGLTPPRRG